MIRFAKLKRKPLKRKYKPTGEREVFLEIWEEREHICSNEKCGRHLGDEPRAHYFSHIKPKGRYPELRLVKENIRLLCFDCHQEADFGYKNKSLPD